MKTWHYIAIAAVILFFFTMPGMALVSWLRRGGPLARPAPTTVSLPGNINSDLAPKPGWKPGDAY